MHKKKLDEIQKPETLKTNYKFFKLFFLIKSLDYIHQHDTKELEIMLQQLKEIYINTNLYEFCNDIYEKWMSSDIVCDNYLLYKFMLDNYNDYVKIKSNDISDDINLSPFVI